MIFAIIFIGIIAGYQTSKTCDQKCFDEKVGKDTSTKSNGFNGLERTEGMKEQSDHDLD